MLDSNCLKLNTSLGYSLGYCSHNLTPANCNMAVLQWILLTVTALATFVRHCHRSRMTSSVLATLSDELSSNMFC